MEESDCSTPFSLHDTEMLRIENTEQKNEKEMNNH